MSRASTCFYLCCLFLMAAAPPSEVDIKGRAHPALQTSDQPLGDVGEWYILDIVETKSAAGTTLTKLDDGSVLASGHDPDLDTYSVTVRTPLKKITAFRLDAVADESLPHSGPGRSSGGNFTLSRFGVTQSPADKPETARAVPLSRVQADYSQRDYDVTTAFDGADDTGWSIGTGGADHYLIARPDQAVGETNETVLVFTLDFKHPQRKGYTLGRFRLSATTADPPPPANSEPQIQPPQVSVGFVTHPIEAFTSSTGSVSEPHVTADHSILVTGGKAIDDTYTMELHTELENITGLRVEAMADPSLPQSGPGRNSPNFILNEIAVEAAPKGDPTNKQPVKLVYPTTTAPRGRQPLDNAIDGNDKTFWGVNGRAGQSHTMSFVFASPVSHEGGTALTVTLRQRLAIGRLRLALTTAREHRFIQVASPDVKDVKKEVTPPPPGKRVELYYNVAGHAYADARGHQWLPARKWRENRDGYIGGTSQRFAASDDALLREGLTGIDNFRVYVPDGRYHVTLVFAEVREGTIANYRRFNIAVEKRVIPHTFDPIVDGGGIGRRSFYVLPKVPVNDGVLDIDFTGEKPILNAIAITGVDDEE